MHEKAVFAIAVATLAVASCVPRGGGDYRISSNSGQYEPASTPATAPRETQVVPQQRFDTPSWSPGIVARNAVEVSGGPYVVKQGDNLSSISRATSVPLAQLAKLNGLTEPYALRIGQELALPGGIAHRVGKGESGIAIARAYGVSWAEVVQLNSIQYPYVLVEGQNLLLPAPKPVDAGSLDPTPEQYAAQFSLNIDDIVTGGEPAAVDIARPSSSSPSVSLASAIARPTSFAGGFEWPVGGSLLSRFGSKGGGKVNDGIDVAAPIGSKVTAAGSGVVVYSGNEINVYGGLVLIDHGSGLISAYGHLGTLNVQRGDRVKQGQLLGSVGTTGYAKQPQLHFEIRKDRKPLDPLTKLPPR